MPYSSADLIQRAADRLDRTSAPFTSAVRRPAQFVPPKPPLSFDETAAPLNDIHRLERTGTIDWNATRAPIMEEIRLIKRRLLNRAFEGNDARSSQSRLVMITSAKPGEGKTFTATNLALSISLEEDYDVVLVDADIARQSVRRNFGLKPMKGFVDLLLNPDIALSDVILRTDIPRLSVLPAGTTSDKAPELLAGSRMRGMIETLSKRFRDRIIIFDSPPCLVSSDAATLAAHVGQILLVVEADQTQEHEVTAALQRINSCPDISIVLNKARSSGSTSYGGYGAY
jgi:receptor protein-tyrosine kinase